jgi:hypothetical protein
VQHWQDVAIKNVTVALRPAGLAAFLDAIPIGCSDGGIAIAKV